MYVLTALDEIECAPLGNARLEALKRCDEACHDLRSILFLALSPDVTFGVKALPKPIPALMMADHTWLIHFTALAGALRERNLTGNKALSDIACFLGRCTPQQRKWTERILKQDLRLNIGAKDVNKVCGKDTIYLFEVPLATDYNKCSEKDFKGAWAVEPKLDGARAVAVLPKKGGPVRMLSRTGKVWGNFEAIRTELQIFNNQRNKNEPDLYLDGEVIAKVNGKINFQAIQKVMMAPDGRAYEGVLHYVIFDAALEQEWKKPSASYERRLGFARGIARELNAQTPTIEEIPVGFASNPTPDALRELCARYVEQGYEGAMIRKLEATVINKRSKTLLKVKMFQDAEATIVGTVQGTGKLVGSLGALVCKTEKGVQFEIGTGLDDAERKRLWTARPLTGTLVSYKFFEITNDGVPRFPVYRSLRSSDDVG